MIASFFINNSYSVTFSLKSTHRESKMIKNSTSRRRTFIVLVVFVSIVCNSDDLKDLSVRGRTRAMCRELRHSAHLSRHSVTSRYHVLREYLPPSLFSVYHSRVSYCTMNAHILDPLHKISPLSQVNVKVSGHLNLIIGHIDRSIHIL